MEFDDDLARSLSPTNISLLDVISQKLLTELTNGEISLEAKAIERSSHHQAAIYRLLAQKQPRKALALNEALDKDILLTLAVYELYSQNGDKLGAATWYEKARTMILPYYGDWKVAVEDKVRKPYGAWSGG